MACHYYHKIFYSKLVSASLASRSLGQRRSVRFQECHQRSADTGRDHVEVVEAPPDRQCASNIRHADLVTQLPHIVGCFLSCYDDSLTCNGQVVQGLWKGWRKQGAPAALHDEGFFSRLPPG